MKLSSIRSRLVIALGVAIVAGLAAFLIQRVVSDEEPEVQSPVSFDVAPDFLSENLPTSTPEPSQTPKVQPRRRSTSTRSAPVQTAAPSAPSDLSSLDDMPAVPDPRPVDPGDL